MAHGEGDLLTGLAARLDAQEAELAGLRAELALVKAGEPVPAMRRRAATPAVPVPRRTAASSRRSLLKGAGALVFSTALLATGEVVPVTPFRVEAADPAPPPRPSGPGPKIAVAADTLYQSFVGTDFQPEVTSKGEISQLAESEIVAGPIIPATAGSQTFSARLNLPQGATIVEVLFFVDHNDTAAMRVDIGAFGAADGNIHSIGSANVTVTSPPPQRL